MTGVLRGKDKGIQKHTHRSIPYDNGNRDWSDVSISRGRPRTADNTEAGRGKKGSPPRACRESMVRRDLDFALLASRTVRE